MTDREAFRWAAEKVAEFRLSPARLATYQRIALRHGPTHAVTLTLSELEAEFRRLSKEPEDPDVTGTDSRS